MIRPLAGTVRGGAVRLRSKKGLHEGQKVVVIAIAARSRKVRLSAEAEAEEVEFARTCRGRLARQLKAEEKANG